MQGFTDVGGSAAVMRKGLLGQGRVGKGIPEVGGLRVGGRAVGGAGGLDCVFYVVLDCLYHALNYRNCF